MTLYFHPQQVHTAEARAQEIVRRAGDLRTELGRAHQDADQARTERDQASSRPPREPTRWRPCARNW